MHLGLRPVVKNAPVYTTLLGPLPKSRITASDVLSADGAISDKPVDHEAGSDDEVENSLPSAKRNKGSASKVATGGKARGAGRASSSIRDEADSSASISFGHESD